MTSHSESSLKPLASKSKSGLEISADKAFICSLTIFAKRSSPTEDFNESNASFLRISLSSLLSGDRFPEGRINSRN